VIRLENVSIHAGSFRLEDVSFEVEDRAYAMLMGRTGSGKTTVLESICGLKPIQAGKIELQGVDVTDFRAADRGIGYVPQDGALFSAMTVEEHLAFALRVRRWNKADIRKRVQELARLLNLEPLLHRKPTKLSGGESQRVALGRALAFRPCVLLLDEPLSALDEETRGQLYTLLQCVRERERVTVLHVTHNSEDVHNLASQLLRLEGGTVTEMPLNAAPAGAELRTEGNPKS